MARARPYGRNEVVASVLDAARELIAERGPSGVSLREIAAAAHVNNGLVFQYLGTKDDLVAEVFRRSSRNIEMRLSGVTTLDEAIEVLMHDSADPDLRLMVWAALESSQPTELFGASDGLAALDPIIRGEAMRAGRDVTDVDVRVSKAVAAMLMTAWRVLGPVARSAGGIRAEEVRDFDDTTVRVIRHILELGVIGRRDEFD